MIKPRLEEMQDVYLKALGAGYASKSPMRILIAEFPMSKASEYVQDDFRVVDCWLVTQDSNNSSGMTTMWYQGVPVWVMHYGGWYYPNVIPFLKKCPRETYVVNPCFVGGRGPRWMIAEELIYYNTVEKEAIDDFCGQERIVSFDGVSQGSHWYRGMTL